MFASEEGKKIFLGSMIFSWAVVFFTWSFSDVFRTVSTFRPYLIVVMVCLLYICYKRPQKKIWKIIFPILTEVLLIVIPILSFWNTIIFLYMIVKYETVVSTGQPMPVLRLFLVALAFLPVLAFPLLRRWRRAEV